ncbi:MAG: KOW domain-containing RNA-binding protein [Clostridiales bacterium]|jgi:ribosomal protein L14E/L6E/L27E|nr:KOW domain-containing RNA-binding protein [Clostridiales bacterium]
MEIGSVVFSKAGRDKGRYYIVVHAGKTEDAVYIADGEMRRLEKPKLKKIKHLRDSGRIIEKLQNKFIGKKTVFDAEIRSALRPFNEESEKNSEEKITDGNVADESSGAKKRNGKYAKTASIE